MGTGTTGVCYIAAPYGAINDEMLEWNVRRALALGRLAATEGLAPLVVHAAAPHVYGSEEGEGTRARGLEGSLSILKCVMFRTSSRLWILNRNDGSRSAGVDAEFKVWRDYRKGRLRSGTWTDWAELAGARGLGALWRSLENPPKVQLARLNCNCDRDSEVIYSTCRICRGGQ